MKQLLILMLITIAGAKPLNVVTSIPDIADMVRMIGGNRVVVTSLATGKEDLHAVPARPNFLPILNKADLLITLGLDAEHAWLPALAKSARNPKITEGQAGWISLEKGITVLNKPTTIARTEGEQHPEGNPHFNVGPQAGHQMAHNIANALTRADPAGKSVYSAGCDKLCEQICAMETILAKKGAVLKGKKIVAYHEDLAYLCAYYGMIQVGTIEVKPGVPPTASHLKKIEEVARIQKADLIIHNQSQSAKIPKKLSVSTSAPVVKIANAVGAFEGVNSWIELQKFNLNQLLKAVK